MYKRQGPGRVNQAIALSGVKNFWHLRNYLPKETRNYVPAFLAAKYMMKHYQEYYLSPNIPRLDFQITKAFKIYNEISFTKIAEITGISREDLNFLNTSYRKDFIPSNTKGFTLSLIHISDLKAGCSLADSCPPHLFRKFKEKYPDHIVVSYICLLYTSRCV